MRNCVLLVVPLVAACAAAPPPPPLDAGSYTCRETGLDAFVGQPATAEAGARILAQSGARMLRWIPHNGAITMDLRHDRVNVRLTAANQIESLTCG